MTDADVEVFAQEFRSRTLPVSLLLELVSIDTEKDQSLVRATIAEGSSTKSNGW